MKKQTHNNQKAATTIISSLFKWYEPDLIQQIQSQFKDTETILNTNIVGYGITVRMLLEAVMECNIPVTNTDLSKLIKNEMQKNKSDEKVRWTDAMEFDKNII